MATKKSPEPESSSSSSSTKKVPPDQNTGESERDRLADIEARKKAREEAVTQEGVTPPENQDVNEPVKGAPETRD